MLARHLHYTLDCLQLAHSSEDTVFLGHSACQDVIKERWTGCVDQKFIPGISSEHHLFTLFQMLLLVVLYWFPGLNWWYFRKTKDDKKAGVSGTDDDEGCVAFYRSPFVKFAIDVMCMGLLLWLLAYVVLTPFGGKKLLEVEIALVVWMACMTVERLRIAYMKNKFSSKWFIWDVCSYFMYYAGFAMRVASVKQGDDYKAKEAKAIYSVTVFMFFLGSLRLYAFSHHLGPKVIVVFKMIGNFATFIMLFGVVLFGYGIAIQGLLFPDVDPDSISLTAVVYRPFFQFFGELQLDEINRDAGCMDGDFMFANCNQFVWVALVLMAAYLVICSIMLINLLIAMLSSTYDTVSQRSMALWYLQFYELVEEYKLRSAFPGPLSIIGNIGSLIAFIANWMSAKGYCSLWWISSSFQANENDKLQENMALHEKLETFQEHHTEQYLSKQQQQHDGMLEQRIIHIDRVVGNVVGMRSELEEILYRMPYSTSSARDPKAPYSEHQRDGVRYDQKLSSTFFLDKMREGRSAPPVTPYPSWERSVSLVRHVLENAGQNTGSMTFRSYPLGTGTETVVAAVVDGKPVCFYENEYTNLDEMHVDGRLYRMQYVPSCLPDGKVEVLSQRFEGPHADGYAEQYYVAPHVLYEFYNCRAGKCPPCNCTCQKKWADEEVNHTGAARLKSPFYNLPFGRTGISGRGNLGRWGRNDREELLVTRWTHNRFGGKVLRDGRPMLQVLLLQQRSDKKWTLPGSFKGNSQTAFMQAFGITSDPKINSALRLDRLVKFIQHELQYEKNTIFQGDIDECRNTDEAWVHAKVIHIHDARNLLGQYDLVQPIDDPVITSVAWTPVHDCLHVASDFHRSLISWLITHRMPEAFGGGHLPQTVSQALTFLLPSRSERNDTEA